MTTEPRMVIPDAPPTPPPMPTALSFTMTVPHPPSKGLAEVIKSKPRRFWASHYLADCLLDTVADKDTIVNHIIIAGQIANIEHFIQPLRETYLRRYDPIVILTPKLTEEEWAMIDSYPEIYIVEGRATNVPDLMRAGLCKCSKLVILSSESQHCEPFVSDKDTLLSVIGIKQILRDRNIFPIYDLADPVNMMFLPGNSTWNQNDPYYLSPSFASGNVFLGTVFDSLLCQCYFNPHLLPIIQILFGRSESSTTKMKILQTELPERFIGARFGFLFEVLMDCNIVCLGLFRCPSGKVEEGFVSTNPSSNTVLNAEDKLFILIRVDGK
eukprot:gene7024-8165_t